MSLRHTLKTLWKRWRQGPADYHAVIQVNAMSEVPDGIPSTTIYVVGSGDHYKWMVFDCPCRKGHYLKVPLMNNIRPHWKLSRRGSRVSVWPSIDVADGVCASHFWLRDNRVDWAMWETPTAPR